MKNVKEGSATGPDGVPARVLKRCAAELAKPFWKLASKVLQEQRWPAGWLLHWVIPLYKKKAVWDLTNYKGVHLTAQLSKATELLTDLQSGKAIIAFFQAAYQKAKQVIDDKAARRAVEQRNEKET